MAVRAVVFDIGGVLEFASPGGGEPADQMEALFTEWDEHFHLAPGALNEQFTLAAHDARSEAEMQRSLVAHTGLGSAQIAAFMDAFWDVYMGEPNAELLAYLPHLRPTYQTAILTNSFLGAREREESRYHFSELVDVLIYSHEEGIHKPAPEIFARTWRRLGVEPGEIVFVDDVPANIAAARKLGIQVVHFCDTAQAVADLERCLGKTAPQARDVLHPRV